MPIYNVTCVICGSSYIQKRKPIDTPKCKKCQKKLHDRNYYTKNSKLIKERQQNVPKERKAQYDKNYYLNNKESILSKNKEYYKRNRELILTKAESRRRELGEKPNGLSGTESIALQILQNEFKGETIKTHDRTTILNPKTSQYLELDFYIPNLKLAIELNGITHYEPVYGEDKLKRQQLNDTIKRNECKRLGIRLVEVPLLNGVHYDRYDTEHEKLKETILNCLGG